MFLISNLKFNDSFSGFSLKQTMARRWELNLDQKILILEGVNVACLLWKMAGLTVCLGASFLVLFLWFYVKSINLSFVIALPLWKKAFKLDSILTVLILVFFTNFFSNSVGGFPLGRAMILWERGFELSRKLWLRANLLFNALSLSVTVGEQKTQNF